MKKALIIVGTILTINILTLSQVMALTPSDQNSVYNNTEYYDPNPCSTSIVPKQVTISLPSGTSIDQQIAQTFMVGIDVQNTPSSVVKDIVSKYDIGGIYFTDTTNALAAGYTSQFIGQLNSSDITPLIVASDEEGGSITRFPYPNLPNGFPNASQMGAMADSAIQQIGQDVGSTMKGYGLTTDLAPVLDLNDGENIIGSQGRSFSNDPNIVGEKAGAFAQGLESSGINPTFKHFPGFGGAGSGNTDTQPVIVPASYSLSSNIIPYQTLLATNTNASVMLSNLYIPNNMFSNAASTSNLLPTSMNPYAVEYLRHSLNFSGLVTTDDLGVFNSPGYVNAGMSISLPNAVTDSLMAGVDMPLFGLNDGSVGQETDSQAEATIQSIIDQVKAIVPTSTINAALSAVMSNKTVTATSNASSTTTTECCSTSGVELVGSSVEDQVFNYFVSKGLTAAQSAGIAGNIEAESSFQPEINESNPHGLVPASVMVTSINYNNRNDGWGLAQWTPPSKIIGPLNQQGQDPNQVANQLQFLWQAINSPGSGRTGSASVIADLQSTNTPQQAAVSFEYNYERPASLSDEGTREAYAETIYVKEENGTNLSSLPPNAQPSTASNSAPSTCNGNSTTSSTSTYQNPLRGLQNLQPSRIDQGVDYEGDGPIYAIGDGTVENSTTSAGWPGGTFISYELTDGPAKGDWVYVAENCTNVQVSVGQTVNSNTVLCNEQDSFPFIETGWAVPQQGDYQAASHTCASQNPDGTATAYGRNFSQLLQSLGAPPGNLILSYENGNLSCGTLPIGWPTW